MLLRTLLCSALNSASCSAPNLLKWLGLDPILLAPSPAGQMHLPASQSFKRTRRDLTSSTSSTKPVPNLTASSITSSVYHRRGLRNECHRPAPEVAEATDLLTWRGGRHGGQAEDYGPRRCATCAMPHRPLLWISRHPSRWPTLPPLLPPPNPRPQQPAQATMLWAASPANKESVSVNTRRVRHFSTLHVLVESAQASVASTRGSSTWAKLDSPTARCTQLKDCLGPR